MVARTNKTAEYEIYSDEKIRAPLILKEEEAIPKAVMKELTTVDKDLTSVIGNP